MKPQFPSGTLHQLEPLARAIEMPRVNLPIANDVGIRKTIEAGLIALEVLLRHRTGRMLIVRPATLTIQRQRQMQETFGLRFETANRDCFQQHRRRRTRSSPVPRSTDCQ